jgi:predicted metal-dependent hydrolase
MSPLYPADELKRRVMSWAVKLKVNPRVVRIQRMSTKWGSCSPSGTITLAFDLVDETHRFQEYVIVHELLHLRYSGHGRVFRAVLGAHVPDWRRLESSRAPNGKSRTGSRSMD